MEYAVKGMSGSYPFPCLAHRAVQWPARAGLIKIVGAAFEESLRRLQV
jgi:hypothetical protein